jgi:hypothetical protein
MQEWQTDGDVDLRFAQVSRPQLEPWLVLAGLIWCMDQSFVVRKDGELNMLCDRRTRCAVMWVFPQLHCTLFLYCFFQEHNPNVKPGLNCVKVGVINVSVKMCFIGRTCGSSGGTWVSQKVANSCLPA